VTIAQYKRNNIVPTAFVIIIIEGETTYVFFIKKPKEVHDTPKTYA